ncbi:MAG: hypothetical protein IT318_00035 [Anaerolineales bacterium]|nr:hypothetical protein [Anaerolineales bacterium]
MGWVFVYHPDYTPLLEWTGWQFGFHIGQMTAWTHPAALGLWLAERWLSGRRVAPLLWGPAPVVPSGSVLRAAVALSVSSAIGQRVPLGVLARLALLAAWYVLCIHAALLAAAVGRLAALPAAEALVAVGQAVAQDNGWLRALKLPWPPVLEAATPGASVVLLAAAETGVWGGAAAAALGRAIG